MTAVHANSLAAHRSELPKLTKRAEAIWRWLEEHGPATDRQIQIAMGFSEPGAIRPRVTESIQAGMLVEVDNVRCQTTGKTVRRVDVRRSHQRELFS